jgi:hypothetical protein
MQAVIRIMDQHFLRNLRDAMNMNVNMLALLLPNALNRGMPVIFQDWASLHIGLRDSAPVYSNAPASKVYGCKTFGRKPISLLV